MQKVKFLGQALMIAGIILAAAPNAVADPPPLPDLPIPQCFGVNIHFMDKDLPAQMALLKKAGFGWIRRDLAWDFIERQKGAYDFSDADKLVDALAAANMRAVMVLDYKNPLYGKDEAPITPQERAAFARFAAAAAAHYAGKGVVWEIYNEPNLDIFWQPRPDAGQYVLLANEATVAIRAAAPDAIIVGPALSGPLLDTENQQDEDDFLGVVLKSNAAHQWNAITVHPYRSPVGTPESAAAPLAAIRAMMRVAGIDPDKTPLISSEWGYSTWLRGVDEPTQAAYAVRTLLWATVEHMPFSIWYDWQDDGPNALDKEYRFGLLRAGSLKDKPEATIAKPAFVAVRQLAQLLSGYRFDTLIRNDDAVVIAQYQRNGDIAYAVWSKDNLPHQASLALPGGEWRIAPIGGQESVMPAGNAALVSQTMPTIIRKKDLPQ